MNKKTACLFADSIFLNILFFGAEKEREKEKCQI